MVKKLGKSWVLSICLSRISHIIDYWHCSTLIYSWNIATQFYNYLSYNICVSYNISAIKILIVKTGLLSTNNIIQNGRLRYAKICPERRLFHDLINKCPRNSENLEPQESLRILLPLCFLFRKGDLNFLKIPSKKVAVDFCFSCRAQTFMPTETGF